MTDKCPSKMDVSDESSLTARELSSASGRTFWRSLDDLVGTREFRDYMEREFPARASELLDGSRRHFLKVMGASLALAGAASMGCRRPDHRIVAYNESPEDIIPGKPLFYATAMPLPGGGCEGLLAETFEGRPTKVEGNPLHPRNRGKSTVSSQASVLAMYDPDRDPASVKDRSGIEATSSEAFRAFAGEHFGAFDANEGAGLAFLVEKATSPSRDAVRRRILSRWPKAKWYPYEACDGEHAREGSEIALGRAARESLSLENAKVVVSLDRDFLCDGGPREARGWAAGRYRAGTRAGRSAADAEMSRLYVLESAMTTTGGAADHRYPMRSHRIGVFAISLAYAVMERVGQTGGLANAVRAAMAESDRSWIDPEMVGAIADDLVAHRGECLVLAGERMDPTVHALVHALNSVLGNVGRTVSYQWLEGDAGASSRAGIAALSSALDRGEVQTLVMVGGNPAYDAPADLGFGDLIELARTSVYLGEGNETAAASGMWVARSHYLEAWGDVVDWDGSYSVVQPMIAPLFDTLSELEFLSVVAGMEATDGYEIVRQTFSGRVGVSTVIPGSKGVVNPDFEARWRRCLHDGVQSGSEGSATATNASVRLDGVARAVGLAATRLGSEAEFDVLFSPCSKVYDGRWANNGWLQELPDSVTKTSWDNPALVSKKTAERLGLNPGRKLGGPQYNKVQMVDLEVGGRTLRLPIWVQPGLADDTIVLTLGYGRRVGGLIATTTGFDTYALRTTDGMWSAAGSSVSPAKGAGAYLIANTQDHWSLEDRDVFREIDLYWWKIHGDEMVGGKDSYGNPRTIRGAGRLGMEGHTPENVNVYKAAPGRGGSLYFHEVDEHGHAVLDSEGRKQRPLNDWGKPIQQWGMSIDLTTCTGCGACTVACQAENNIPVVGKMEVAKGREMHWIRVDRYYASDSMDEAAFANPDMVVQPVPCMQCEQAPCEVVCPVSATTHGPQGTNDMAYNRCIGTRYCSNNCPYKVRRFNFFDYGTKALMGTTGLDGVLPEGTNKALVPPRLREKVSEVASMQKNPHVTVRSRGVMEKCTYCIQRINAASVETKLSDLDFIPDGFFETACQQACPTGSIVFGDIYDYAADGGKGSAVSRAKADPRTFAMLAYLNTTPRTSYQLRVRNPNERLRPRVSDPFEHHGHGDHGDHGDHGHDHDDGHGHGADDHGSHGDVRLPVLTGWGVPA